MGWRSPGFGERGNERGGPKAAPTARSWICQRRRSHSWVTSYAECRMATCLRSILSGGVFGSSGHRIMKSFLSMPVMTASHQPFAEPSFSQYFANESRPAMHPRDLVGRRFQACRLTPRRDLPRWPACRRALLPGRLRGRKSWQ